VQGKNEILFYISIIFFFPFFSFCGCLKSHFGGSILSSVHILEECGPRVTTNGGFKQFAFSSLI
jgi:hypothetical protein